KIRTPRRQQRVLRYRLQLRDPRSHALSRRARRVRAARCAPAGAGRTLPADVRAAATRRAERRRRRTRLARAAFLPARSRWQRDQAYLHGRALLAAQRDARRAGVLPALEPAEELAEPDHPRPA